MKRRRAALGIARPPHRTREETTGDIDLLRELGPVTVADFAAKIGRSYASARIRLRKLVARGVAEAEGEAKKNCPQTFRAL